MPLTVRTNGSGSSNIISSGWFNDFLNLFTGAMTDQPITFKYTPGAAGTVVTITPNANSTPLVILESDGVTTGFKVDNAGNASATGKVNIGTAVSGVFSNITYNSGLNILVYAPPLAGGSTQGHLFQIWNGSAFVNLFSIGAQFSTAKAWTDASGDFFIPVVNIGASVSSSFANISYNSGSAVLVIAPPEAGGAAQGILLQSWNGSGVVQNFSVGGQFASAVAWVDTGGALHSDVHQAASHTYIGFKNSAGTKIAEFRGDAVISGTTYWTTQASAGFNNSASFDAFDVSEAFSTDTGYDGGTVVCPGDDGVMHRCEHDGCPFALVVSKVPGIALGGGDLGPTDDGPRELLAVAGRVRVRCDSPVPFKALVTSDGRGGVRATRPGDYALGYALHEASDGSVGVLLRH